MKTPRIIEAVFKNLRSRAESKQCLKIKMFPFIYGMIDEKTKSNPREQINMGIMIHHAKLILPRVSVHVVR